MSWPPTAARAQPPSPGPAWRPRLRGAAWRRGGRWSGTRCASWPPERVRRSSTGGRWRIPTTARTREAEAGCELRFRRRRRAHRGAADGGRRAAPRSAPWRTCGACAHGGGGGLPRPAARPSPMPRAGPQAGLGRRRAAEAPGPRGHKAAGRRGGKAKRDRKERAPMGSREPPGSGASNAPRCHPQPRQAQRVPPPPHPPRPEGGRGGRGRPARAPRRRGRPTRRTPPPRPLPPPPQRGGRL